MGAKEELHQLVDQLPFGRVETAKRVLAELCERPADGSRSPGHGAPTRPIEEILKELAAEIPQEEWERLPADLTDNLDHYLYGTPKR
jgi:hypothetical protein